VLLSACVLSRSQAAHYTLDASRFGIIALAALTREHGGLAVQNDTNLV
jgi:hypothetical protein